MNRQILRLALPNILSNISVPLLGMVDTALMGRMESDVYLSAIALGGSLFSFIYFGLAFIRMGTTGMTAQAFGAKDRAEGTSILARAILVALGLSALLWLLQYPIGELGFRLMEGDATGEKIQQVGELAREYFYIRIWAAPATLGIMALMGWFFGMQNARYPMYITIAVNVCNILFNFLFVYQFEMKSDGVAWGTVIAQYIGLILGLIFFFFRYREQLDLLKFRKAFELSAFKHFFSANSCPFSCLGRLDIVCSLINMLLRRKGQQYPSRGHKNEHG